MYGSSSSRFVGLQHHAAAAEVDEDVHHLVLVLEVVRAAEVDEDVVRLVEAAGGVEPGLLGRDHERAAGLAEADEVGELGLHDRALVRAERLGEQQRQAHHELGVHAVADLGLEVDPVELALRVPLRVVGVADVLDLVPRDEDVVEVDHPVELVADRGQRAVVRVGVGLGARLARHDRDARRVDRDERVDRLLRRLARAPQVADEQLVDERDRRADRLPAPDDDALVGLLLDAPASASRPWRRRGRGRTGRRGTSGEIATSSRVTRAHWRSMLPLQVAVRALEDGVLRPRLGVVGLRVHDDVHARRRAGEDAALELAEPELVVRAAALHVLLGAREEPVHRLAVAVVVDERRARRRARARGAGRSSARSARRSRGSSGAS